MGHRQDAPHQTLGGRVGPRVALLIQKALADYHLRTRGEKAFVHAEGLNQFFRGMSDEKRNHTRPLWEQYLGSGETTPEVEAVLRFIAHGQGELSEVMGSLGLGQAVGTSILSSIQNVLAPINQKLIQADPNALLDANTAAAARLSGFMSEGFAEGEAAKQGIDGPRFGVLMEMAYNYPGLSELLELWRRGVIGDGDIDGVLKKQRISPAFIPALLNLKREHLAPADAALMVLKGIIPESEGASIAEIAGLTHSDFDLVVKMTGEPPGLMQLLEAYRRGFIDKPRLEKGIKQSRVRDEWTDVIERLRFVPASPSDALRGVVQHHLPEAEGKRIAEEGGLRPEDWNWLVETEGNPIAMGEALTLFNRGFMSEAQVEQAMRESRLKNKYTRDAMHLSVKLPPAFQIGKMIQTGSMTEKRGMELLRWEGYPKDVAESFAHSATSAGGAKAKELSTTQVLELYHDLALTEAECIKHLEVLGYHKGNAQLLIKATDLKRERTLQQATLSPIRSAYIARHITEQEAGVDIDKIGIPATQKAHLLALWTIERSAHRRTLTEAQIIKANMQALFTDQETLDRLMGLGYPEVDAKILMNLEKGRANPV